MHNGSWINLANIVNEDRKFVFRRFVYRRFCIWTLILNVMHNGSKVSLVNIVNEHRKFVYRRLNIVSVS